MPKKDKEDEKIKPRKATGILTTGMVIEGKGLPIPPETRPAALNVAAAHGETQAWSSAQASATPGLPSHPDMLQIDENLSLVAGVYLFAAPTGSGKTIQCMALTALANSNGVPASYVSCFEPRAPVETSATSSVSAPYTNPGSFWPDAESQMYKGSGKPGLIIYDSCTLPLKAYSSNAAYKTQSTFPGGMQPSDRGFVDYGSKLATKYNKCLILVLNSTLVPYVNELAGASEGLINITSITTFTYMDRSSASGRKMVEYTIPNPFVQGALDYFKLGELRPASQFTQNQSYVI
jgi:hypothetical protein